MHARIAIPLTVLLATLALPVRAQMPVPGAAPLLNVRIIGPPGSVSTWYVGSPRGREFPTPAPVALRPGYIYRLELSGLPGRPGVSLFPTLEVRGTLLMKKPHSAAAYAAPVVLNEDDIAQALSGALVTKVIYLEDPEKAIPLATTPDLPLETEIAANRDPLAESRDLGRPVLVVRLGQRLWSQEEMAHQIIPGTVLLPGDSFLGQPRFGPMLPVVCFPWYDPLLGPPPPDECLHNGGIGPTPLPPGPTPMRPLRPGLDSTGRVQGLNPEDTVAEYTDSHGRRSLAKSNRVCLCVPRFAVLRQLVPLGRVDVTFPLVNFRQVEELQLQRRRLPSQLARVAETPVVARGQQRPSGNIAVQTPVPLVHLEVLNADHVVLPLGLMLGTEEIRILTPVQRARVLRQMELARELSQPVHLSGLAELVGPVVIGRIQNGPELVQAVAETRELTVCCEKPCPPDKPLVLFKWCDRQCAQVGDVVQFNLRYTNHGGRTITDIAISDSLGPRLEYIAGSASSTRDAVFTMQENEAGSLLLRWEVSGELPPGESGLLRFKARVR